MPTMAVSQEEERDEVLLHPFLYGFPGDEHAQHREEGREEDEEEADAVYAEGVAHAPFGEPLRLFHELHARCLLVEEKKGQGDGKLDEGEDEGKALYEGLELPVHEEEKDCPEERDVYQGAQYGKGKLVHRDLQDNLYYQIAKDCYGACYHAESIPLDIPGLDEPDETAQPLQDLGDAVHVPSMMISSTTLFKNLPSPNNPRTKDCVIQLIHVILVVDRAEEPRELLHEQLRKLGALNVEIIGDEDAHQGDDDRAAMSMPSWSRPAPLRLRCPRHRPLSRLIAGAAASFGWPKTGSIHCSNLFSPPSIWGSPPSRLLRRARRGS